MLPARGRPLLLGGVGRGQREERVLQGSLLDAKALGHDVVERQFGQDQVRHVGGTGDCHMVALTRHAGHAGQPGQQIVVEW